MALYIHIYVRNMGPTDKFGTKKFGCRLVSALSRLGLPLLSASFCLSNVGVELASGCKLNPCIFMYICMSIYICTYMYMYTYVQMYVCVYIYVYTHVDICVYTNNFTYLYIYIHTADVLVV